jgi:uracil-DNA glycosylase
LQPKVLVAFGHVAWRAVLSETRRRGWLIERPPKFSHGARIPLAEGRWLLGSYHPSQQNTFTGKLTEPMFDAVFAEARRLVAKTLKSKA